MPQSWVVNISFDDLDCKNELVQNSNNKLGLDQSFFDSGILFFIIGMGFGISYNLVYVDCLDWVHTTLLLRIIRTVIGLSISALVYWGFLKIPANDNPTKYFFHYVLPALTISFFIYGLFPVICMKCKLVQVKEEDKQRLYSDIQQRYNNPSVRQSVRKS